MIIKCSYCDRKIGERSEGMGVSHGVCALCALQKAGESLANASLWLGTARVAGVQEAGAAEDLCDQLVRDVGDLETKEQAK